MSSVSEGKKCEKDGYLGSEFEGIDQTLDSSSDGMTCVNSEEKCSEWLRHDDLFLFQNFVKSWRTFPRRWENSTHIKLFLHSRFFL